MQNQLFLVGSHFAVDSTIAKIEPLGEGFINDTFIVVAESSTRYILQRKNSKIFTDVPSMMDNIAKVSDHIKAKVVRAGGNPAREAMTIIPTHEDKLYFIDSQGEYWAMCLFIEDTAAYNRADTPALAEAGGRGIGKFQAMLADFSEPLTDILPGFHDMGFRFKQWDAVIAADVVGRVAEVRELIDWVEARRERVLSVWGKVVSGEIPTRVTHNDTKINNILFTPAGDVLCVIDLDTVLSATILNDFGDCVRTYTNTGEEDDADLSKVTMSIEMFEGLAKGYLAEAGKFLTTGEINNLAYAGAYITTEQVLRFLMDYIGGDTYYKIKSADHNLVRSRAQIALVQSIEAQSEQMKKIIEKWR